MTKRTLNAARPGRLLPAAAAAVLLVLGGCAGFEPAAPPAAPVAVVEDGAEAFQRGDYAEAASRWQREALEADAARASTLRIRAADAWLLAGDPDNAENLLRWVDSDGLATADRARLNLVLADLALRRNRPDEAQALLERTADNLPGYLVPRYEGLESRLQGQMERPGSRNLARAAALVEAMRYYDPLAAQELMRVLEYVSSGELAIRAANPRAERQLTGWLDLALVVRQNLARPENVSGAVTAWKARQPGHLLTESQALDTFLRYRQGFQPPQQVAVLVPTDGRLRAAGEAIRDGLMSAYTAHPAKSELRFYAIDDDPQSVVSAYFNALDAGADQIVGPLRKESVEAVLSLAGLATPVLALNDLPEGYLPPPGLAGQVAGLSLSQEAEVKAIAAHAAAWGYERALVLAPESDWGERMAALFEGEFLQDDRQIAASARYPEGENDHSALLERALGIDESKARAQRLENTLGMTLEFEPMRRDDVDVIFMAADEKQAKLLRPQLRFLDAGDVPVYATGRIYSGRPDPAGNQDLDGVRFPATPWELAHTEKDEVPGFASLKGGTLGDLFSVGQDAWDLLPWLPLMRKDPGFVFPGHSGAYRLALDGKLNREPAWAVFADGRPRALPARPEPAEPTQQPDNVPRGLPLQPPEPVTDVAGQ